MQAAIRHPSRKPERAVGERGCDLALRTGGSPVLYSTGGTKMNMNRSAKRDSSIFLPTCEAADQRELTRILVPSSMTLVSTTHYGYAM